MVKDIIGWTILGLIGIIYYIYSLSYNLGTAVRPGPGFFPRVVGILLIISTVVPLVIQFSKFVKAKRQHLEGADQESVLYEKNNIQNAIIIVATVMLFIIAIEKIGYIVSVILLLAVLQKIFGSKETILDILISLGLGISTYWIFWSLMRVPLPGLKF